jgi:hypothetical protein
MRGHVEVVKLLMDRGAQVDAKGRGGLSAMVLAAHGGHEGVMKLLRDGT